MSAKERILTIRLMDKAIRNPIAAEKLVLHAGLEVLAFASKNRIAKERGESYV